MPLSKEEEEEAIIEMALHDWATQGGRSVPLEKLVIERQDPASLEAQRDRALQAEIERQRRFRAYKERNAHRTVSPPQPTGPPQPVLWEQGPRPSATPPIPGLSPDLEQQMNRRGSPPAGPAPAPQGPRFRRAASEQAGPADDEKPAPVRRTRPRVETAAVPAEDDKGPAVTPAGKKAATGRTAPPKAKVTAKPTSRKPDAKKATVEKDSANKATVTALAKKATAGKAPAKRATAKKAPVATTPKKTTPTKASVAAPAKKAAAERAPVKKAAAKKAPAKKAAAKKAPAKKALADKSAVGKAGPDNQPASGRRKV